MPAGGLSSDRPAIWMLALFCLAYFGAGTLCDGLSLIPGVAIIFWPPVGILIATLLLNPRASWPWWIAAGGVAELTCNAVLWGNPLQYALIYYSGNALEALAAAYLVGRFAPKPFRFETIEQVVSFLIFGAGIAPTVSATVIATADAFRGKHLFTTAWPLVWLGDATGMLVSAPLTFVAVQAWRDREYIQRSKFVEAGIVFAALLSIGGLSIAGTLPASYLVMPPLLWIALRFRLKGTAVALGLLTLMAGSFTVAGVGQFASSNYPPELNLVRFHIFIAVCAVSSLFVAVLSQQRLKVMEQLEVANRDLERRMAEQSGDLVASEARLQLATNSARVGTWEADLTTGLGSWSPEAVELFGIDRSDFNGHDWVEAAHPDDRERIGEAWRRAISDDQPYEVEFRSAQPAADGGDRWLLSRGKVERDGKRNPVRGAGVLLDITELRRVRNRLSEQSDQMRLVTDAMPALISYIDADRKYQFINIEYEKWFGFDRDGIVGKTIAEVLGDDAQEKVEPYLRRVFAGEDVRFEAHINYQRAGWKWVEAHYLPDLTEDGSVRGFFGLVLDISRQKELDKRIREQFEELESIYASVPVGLAVIDRDLCYLRVNEWLAEMNGLPAHEHVGRSVRDVVPSLAEKAEAILKKVIETGEPIRDVVLEGDTAAQPSVQRAWSEIWTPVKNAEGETIAASVVVEDVTERNWAESLLSEQNRLLEMIAKGRPMGEVLTEITAVIGRLEPRTRAAVLVADRSRDLFESAFAFNIPTSYTEPLVGVKIEEVPIGTCCKAVYCGEAVTSADVANDDRWTNAWRELCLQHGIRACHSEPVFGEDARPIGTVVLGFDTPREPDARGLRIAAFGAHVAGIAIERARAEEALAASEDKYRVLFDSMDEGYCIIEMIFDDAGRAIDYRFREVNSAFERQAGMQDVVGKRMLEFVPAIEDHWLISYGSVARTGIPIRFDNEYKGLHKWFDVYAFRPESWERNRIAVIFTDITERKNAEAELAAAATRDDYRVRLADTIRGLADPEDVKRAAARLLGEQLGANRAFYADVRDGDWILVKGFETGVEPIPDGPYSSKDFGEWIIDTYRSGERFVFSDVGNDPRFTSEQREAHTSASIYAAVGIPLVKTGDLVAILAIHHASPRNWTEDEIALVDETAERTWSAVERVLAERALRESEERLRMATEAARIYSWEIDVARQELHWGPNAADVLGFPADALTDPLGDAFALVHPDDVEMTRAVIETAIEGNGSFQMEFRMVHPVTGEAVWTSSQAAVVNDETGSVRIVGISQNITERKFAEERLRASERENREILESISDAFFSLDSQWRFSYTNRQAEEVLGHAPGALIGKVIWDMFPGLVGSKFETAYRNAMEERVTSTLTDFYPDHDRWYEVHVYPRASLGGSRGVSVYFRNVTERMLAEQAVRASEQTFRQLVENSPFGIYVVDADFKLARVGAGAQKVFENVRPLIGRDFAEVLRVVWEEPFATEAINIFRNTLETGESYHAPRLIEPRGDIAETEAYDWKTERITMPDGRFGVVCHFYDLSERLRYEQELRDAELRFRSTFEQAAVGIAQVSPDGRWVMVNERLCEILGYTRTELLARSFGEITHPEDVQADLELVRSTLAGEIDRYDMNKRYIRRDGRTVWANLTVSLVREADGSPKYFVSVVEDITDRVIAEAALRDSEARYRAVVESQSEMICRFRLDGTFLFVNEAYANLMGTRADEVAGSNFWSLIPDPDRDNVRGMLSSLSPQSPEARIENRLETPNGVIWTLWTNRALAFDENDRAIELQSTGIDITEIKVAEAKIRESEERFRNMADNAPVMIWVTESDGNCSYLSQSWYDSTGQTPETGLGFGWLDATHPDDANAVENVFLAANAKCEPFRVEYRLRNKEGEYRWAIDSAQPRFSDGGVFLGYIGSVIDIHERKEAEEQRRRDRERFDIVRDGAEVGFWFCDLPFDELIWDNRVKEHFWLPPDARVTIDTFYDRIHPDDRERTREAIAASNINRTQYDIEYRTVEPERGREKWIRAIGRTFFDEHEQPIRFDGVTLDITEKKLAEAAVAESEYRYRTLFETIDEGFCVIEFLDGPHGPMSDYVHIEANPAYTANAGIPDIVGKRLREFVSETEADGWAETYRKVLLSGESVRFERELVETGRHLELAAFRVEPAERRQVAVLFKDITARNLAEAELRENRERLQAALDGSGAGTFRWDIRTNALEWDENLDRLFGLAPGLTARSLENFVDMVHPDDRAGVIERCERCALDGSDFDMEFRVVMPSGEIRWLDDKGKTYLDAHGRPAHMTGMCIDITERKRAVEALLESERFATQLAEVAPNILYIYDLDAGRNIWGNREMTTLLGYTRERIEELGENLIATLMHPDDQGPYQDHLRRLRGIADGDAAEFEYRMKAVDGTWRWLVSRDMIFRRREDGRPRQIVGAAVDVTERKKAENALREQTELLRAITESTPDLIFAKDSSGRLIMANKATLDVIGQTEESAIGRLDSELYDPLEADLIMANDRRVMQLGRTETMEEVVTTGSDARTYLTTKNPLRGSDGRIVGVVGVSHDITALKRVEIALRESETRQRLALEAGRMGTWTWPMKGRDCYADERTLALFGIPANEWNGDAATLNSRRHPADVETVDRSVAKAISQRSIWKGEYRVVHPDGSIHWIAGIGRLEFDRLGEPVLMRGISFDITERKQAEEELRSYHSVLEETVRERTRELAEANQELQNENRERRLVEEERQKLLAQLVAVQEEERRRIAQDLHDQLGQQLTALNLKMEAALQSAADGATTEHLREAKLMMRRIDEDVDELAWQLRPAILDDDGFLPALRRYVEDWSSRFEVLAEFWADEFLETGGPLTAEAETHLYRITQEALNNIAKYAKASHVEVLLKRRGGSAVLMVQDNGGGFDIGSAENGNGKRMGLIGMRERAGLVGGTFQVESSFGEGTTIFVQVPFAEDIADGTKRNSVAGP